MHHEVPPAVRALLQGGTMSTEEWQAFLDAYSTLIVQATRQFGGDEDAVMDRYAFVLEHLQRDGCRRLRTYDRRSRFTTWLVAVVRNLCVDAHRQAYGRRRADETADAADARAERRRLARLLSEAVDVESLVDAGSDPPDARVREAELQLRLAQVLDALEPGDRLLLRLRFVDGLTVPRLARVLRLPTPFHGYRRLDALLARLRAALEARGVTDPVP